MIDLGVMVPMEKILDTAAEVNADLIGLSGLITPSLDEMVQVAGEMQRRGLDVPLMIGGATTSKAHTAVKIEPAYHNGTTVYVPDASRSVSVAARLVSPQQRAGFSHETRQEYQEIRRRTSVRAAKREYLSLEAARRNAFACNWEAYEPPRPAMIGVKTIRDLPLETLIPYIDWSPFFLTWELAGKYPAILDDPVIGDSARDLFRDATEMLERLCRDGRLKANAVLGIWPCNRTGPEELTVFADEERKTELAKLQHLRQQTIRGEGRPNYSLADFVGPPPVADYIGAFAVTAGVGIEDVLAEHKNDDYGSIMIKALADRLAEALAEYLHEHVRRVEWGYAPEESLRNEELIGEGYRGIRPAPGYPACPEHSEKATLFRLLDAQGNADMKLTESFAMLPAASVAGWYFSHPDARYFGIGKINDEQVADYARRKGITTLEAEDLLRPNLDR